MANKYKWDRNIWTGNYIANVTDEIRLIRVNGISGHLYSAERNSIRGPWESTPAKAIRELKIQAGSVVVKP